MPNIRLTCLAACVALGASFSAGCGKERVIMDAKNAAGLAIGSLTFSGDEKDLTFSAGDWTASPSTTKGGVIQLARTSGGKPREIELRGCSISNVYKMKWANKRRKIAYAARDSIHILTQKGSNFVDETVLEGDKSCDDPTPGEAEIFSLVWAPEDLRIAFSTTDNRVGVLIPDTGQRELVHKGGERVTLLAWTKDGLLTKEGKRVYLINPDTKQRVERADLGDEIDYVTATTKGLIYTIDDKGRVKENKDGRLKTVYTVKSRLRMKKGRRLPGTHWYRIEVSPYGSYLAIAEGQGDAEESGTSVLLLVSLPRQRSAPTAPQNLK